MSDEKIYRQVLIKKTTENGYRKDVVWIPNYLAKKGKKLSFKQTPETWDEGWVVDEIYNARVVEDLDQWRKAHKHFQEVLEDH